jgi:hypothetical protein
VAKAIEAETARAKPSTTTVRCTRPGVRISRTAGGSRTAEQQAGSSSAARWAGDWFSLSLHSGLDDC